MNASPSAPWRIGTVPYLVAKPLTLRLAEHPEVELIEAPPVTLANMLRAEELDIALASSVLALDDPPLHMWPEGPVIACDGPIRSVLLFLAPHCPTPGHIQSWSPDPHSRTGRKLSAWLMQNSWSCADVACFERPADANPFHFAKSQEVDAVQIIGDPALQARERFPNWTMIDLGQAWKDATTLPFVFAGWMTLHPFVPDPLAELLHQAAQQGLKMRRELAQQAAAEQPENRSFLEDYLCQDLHYRLPRRAIRECLERLASPATT